MLDALHPDSDVVLISVDGLKECDQLAADDIEADGACWDSDSDQGVVVWKCFRLCRQLQRFQKREHVSGYLIFLRVFFALSIDEILPS